MTIPFFEVVAFSDRLFAGNPAGVCLLAEWLPDSQMQAIAAENNLAETAFLIERNEHFDLRWMTPTVEVELCGHATLAAAHVIFRHLQRAGGQIRFQTQGGELTVDRAGERLVLDFPSRPAKETTAPNELIEGLRARPSALLEGRDYLAVFETAEEVAALRPILNLLRGSTAKVWSRRRREKIAISFPATSRRKRGYRRTR